MVTLNMESRNPMGRVYAENRSKTPKLLGVKALNRSKTKTNHDLLACLFPNASGVLVFASVCDSDSLVCLCLMCHSGSLICLCLL